MIGGRDGVIGVRRNVMSKVMEKYKLEWGINGKVLGRIMIKVGESVEKGVGIMVGCCLL